jgi:nondiscriminating aspartyl-tRNA synthetase
VHQGRSFIGEITPVQGQTISICGWIYYLRVLAQTTFIVVKDCTGILQCVMPTNLNNQDLHLRLDDCVEINGHVNMDPRSQCGFELHVTAIRKLSESSQTQLPFNSSSQVEKISSELQIENRPLVLRSEKSGGIFKLQASVIELFREYLRKNHFTEIVTSKIVAGGTEGGTNLFQMKYFDKVAYLAQSPQFYKEQGVAGFERVFETGHVYRAEPHATSRHLTEYYSLDVEMGFIKGPEEIIELERGLLNFMFERLNSEHRATLEAFRQKPLASLEKAPVWEFGECLERLKQALVEQILLKT